MTIIIVIIGLLVGFLLNIIIERIFLIKIPFLKYGIFFISGLLVFISFSKFGFNKFFLKAVILDSILIVVSFIDFQYKIIPNILVGITLFVGIIFVLFDNISIINTLLGMLIGGGILFLLALIPKAIGGGDVKLMFALGLFLTPQKVVETLLLAFVFSALISLVLLIFKIKGRKDYIPFGPFLAFGCFVTFHFIT